MPSIPGRGALVLGAVLVWAAVFVVAAADPGGRQTKPEDAERLLTRLAIETAPDGDLPPIEVRIERERQFTVYDRFRLVALAARAALAAGHPLDPGAPPPELRSPKLVILAFPRSPVSNETVQPQHVSINGRTGRRLKADEIRSLLPGVDVPPLTVAVSFAVASLQPSDRVSIQFNERAEALASLRPGNMVPGTFAGQVHFTPPEAIDIPDAVLPAGVTLSKPRIDVTVEGVLDLTGRVRYARALDGPEELRPAALSAVDRWRYKPAKMVGVAVPLVMQAKVSFTR